VTERTQRAYCKVQLVMTRPTDTANTKPVSYLQTVALGHLPTDWETQDRDDLSRSSPTELRLSPSDAQSHLTEKQGRWVGLWGADIFLPRVIGKLLQWTISITV
jgi:hypothetical protein